MKIWVLVFVCFFSAKAFASVADSGKCPWKLPFTIAMQARGSQHDYELARTIISGGWYEHDSDYGFTQTTDMMVVTIDTLGSYLSDSVKYSLKDDVLNYSKISSASSFGPPASIYTSVRIVFAHGKDSIMLIEISGGDSSQWGNGQGSYEHYDFAISNLAFDDLSIFSSDTSFQRHNISYTDSYEQVNHYTNDYDYDESFKDFTATSVGLSGIFRPIAFGRSGIGVGSPWKVPFTVQVHARGFTSSSGYFNPAQGPGTGLNNAMMPASEDFSFIIDSTYTLRNDTLRSNGESANESIMIAFAHGVDSIISIMCTQNLSGESITFVISSLYFDSTGIYTIDSSFRHHNTSVVDDRSSTNYIGRHDYISNQSRFVASLASLSGIFKPITLKDSATAPRPVHIPFQMAIQGEGILDSLGAKHTSTNDLSITVWYAIPSGSDTLLFNSGIGNNDTSLEIYFVPGTDSVSMLRLKLTNLWVMAGAIIEEQWYVDRTESSFAIDGLEHDSFSIFSLDSSFCAHNISIVESHASESYYNSQLSTDTMERFTATSAILSGIFRPIHYTCSEAVSEEKPSSDFLLVASLNNSLHCSFTRSQEPRRVAIYSILGIQVASSQISTGSIEATIPNLSPGFYFVRLGNEVAKAIIP